MKLRKKTEQQTADANASVVQAVKGDAAKKRTVLATVWPQGDGYPYEVQVQPDGQGCFTVGDDLTFVLQKGSVIRGTDGQLRTNAREGNPLTFSLQSFQDDDLIHTKTLHRLVHNNLLEQRHNVANRGSMWRQAGTWGMVGVGIALCLLTLWMIKTVGSGFEEMSEALRTIQVSSGTGGAAPSGPAGHNPIAPGGR